ncbi:N5,N10-methylene tetrahydromethanopterin reductase OS=Streptomyces microflavus OX=1919 GN=hmd PE=4 SV=1 [Streptomyces microflavus]
MPSPTLSPAVGVLLPRDLPTHLILPFARRAEELGFGSVWVVEDLGFRGGVAQAASVLASTSRIRVGIGLLPAGARNVAFAALEIATLAQLFPGRTDVGVGHGMPGWMRSVGQWPRSPLTFLEEYIDSLRALLRGEGPEVRGR